MSSRDHPDWWRPTGGQNSQDSILERRSIVSNNGVVPIWAGGSVFTAESKFFPRGMRGWLEYIDIYCQDTGAVGDNIIVNVAPYPGAGTLYTATIIVPPGGAAAWRTATFRTFWNYDSMYIWFYWNQAVVQVAYDNGLPLDSYVTGRFTPPTRFDIHRWWVRVTMTGETPGDVPVSGTLNTIGIPNTVSDMDAITVTINGPDTEDIIFDPVSGVGYPRLGMGQITCLMMTLNEILGAVPDTAMEIHIVTDGVDRMFTVAEIRAAISDVVNTPTPITMGLVTPATNTYQVSFNVKIPFRMSLRVYVENTAAAGNNMTVDAIYVYELLA